MSFLSNVAVNLVSSTIQGLGIKSFGLLSAIRNRPEDMNKLSDYEQATKQTAISSILTNERILEELMGLALQNSNMQLHRLLDSLRTKISSIRHAMESASLLIYPNSDIKSGDIIRNVSMFHICIVYHSFVVENKAIQLRDDYEFDPAMDTKEILRDMRTSTTALESIWNLRPKMAINEETSKALKEQLKNVSKDVVELIEKVSESSLTEAENAFKEVSLKKPKLLGKGKYIENLGDIMRAMIKESGQNEMNNLDLLDRLKKKYPDTSISFDDMEKAARQLLDKRLIHGIRQEEKHYVIELRKSGESPTCGNCKKSGGFMVDYYSCPKGFVCSNCISFFGSCKVCGSKIKNEDHKLIA